MAYLDYLTQVKPILGIPAAHDTIGELVTNAVCDKIEDYTGIAFSPKVITLSLQSLSDIASHIVGGLYRPPLWPVDDVKINGISQTRVSHTLWKLDDQPPFTLTITGGYTTVPKEIELLTLRLIQHQYNLLRSKVGAIQTTGIDGGPTIAYSFDMPLDVQQGLRAWRSYSI